jgi:hypothetical protein
MELSKCKRGEWFIFSGVCPHCTTKAAFESVTKPYTETIPGGHDVKMVSALQCHACNKYILGIVRTARVNDFETLRNGD